jgi:hypothetical protein
LRVGIDVSEDSKAAEDWSEYAIPTDAEMLAKHNANEIRKLKHLVGILHNMVLDGNYHGKHEANALRKQVNELAKATVAIDGKQCEIVHRVIGLEASDTNKQERIDGQEAQIVTIKERQDRQGNFMNTLRKKGDAE